MASLSSTRKGFGGFESGGLMTAGRQVTELEAEVLKLRREKQLVHAAHAHYVLTCQGLGPQGRPLTEGELVSVEAARLVIIVDP
jgi:hypothetical protein